MKLFKKIKNKMRNLSISKKLRLISSLTLVIPLTLSAICCAIIYLTFITGDYPIIVQTIESSQNTNYSYSAFEYICENYEKLIIKSDDDDISKLFNDTLGANEQGVVYLQVTKNDELIYHTSSYEKPENFDNLYSLVDNECKKMYTVVDENIIFRYTLTNDGNNYIIFATGPVRTFHPYEKTVDFYIGLIKTNSIIIFAVFVGVFILSKILTDTVFKRVTYSLNILSDGVQKISSGDLDYRIIYTRNDEFKPICESFNEMAMRLKTLVETIRKQDNNQKEIILGISHDVFSPLTSIKAYVEGLQAGVATTKEMQNKYLEIINKKADQIEKTVSEMLFYSKIERNVLKYNKTNINLEKFINTYIDDNYSDYAIKNIQIKNITCESALICADTDLLSRAITNIIDNSGKYSNKPVCHVDLSVENFGDVCRLTISDDGPGVPQEDIDNLFDMFYTVDKARQNPAKSNGIGLSIVNNIICKVHCGKVKAINKPQGGLSVIIEFPIVKE